MLPLWKVGVPTMILAVCLLLLDTVTAVQLPGVAWPKLEIWEASAFADVWSRSTEYLNPGSRIVPRGNTAAVGEVRRAAWDA